MEKVKHLTKNGREMMKQFKINTQQYCLIQLSDISTRTVEGKQRYFADIILHR